MKGNKFNFFNARTLSNLIVICAGVFLYILLANFGQVRVFIRWFFSVFSPFVLGITIAYLLNIPVRFFEQRVFPGWKYKRGIAVLLTYIVALLFVFLLIYTVLPQVWESVLTLAGNIPGYLLNLNNLVNWATTRFELDPENLKFLLITYKDLVNETVTFAKDYIPNLPSLTGQIVSGVVGGLTAFIASIYMLLAKDKLVRQMKRMLYALLSKRRADEMVRVGKLSNNVFSGFIGGKILDSAIIGAICFLFMTIMNAWVIKMPFALLIRAYPIIDKLHKME